MYNTYIHVNIYARIHMYNKVKPDSQLIHQSLQNKIFFKLISIILSYKSQIQTWRHYIYVEFI